MTVGVSLQFRPYLGVRHLNLQIGGYKKSALNLHVSNVPQGYAVESRAGADTCWEP
jgi:hypothetical protein